jgi:hypothetical protein
MQGQGADLSGIRSTLEVTAARCFSHTATPRTSPNCTRLFVGLRQRWCTPRHSAPARIITRGKHLQQHAAVQDHLHLPVTQPHRGNAAVQQRVHSLGLRSVSRVAMPKLAVFAASPRHYQTIICSQCSMRAWVREPYVVRDGRDLISRSATPSGGQTRSPPPSPRRSTHL